MRDFRCQNCNRLLARVEGMGKVEIKCTRCKSMNLYMEEEVIITVDESPPPSSSKDRLELQKRKADLCTEPGIAEA